MTRRQAVRCRAYVVLAFVAACALACAVGGQWSGARIPYAALIVENVGLSDAHVWVTRQGMKGRKLGIVPGAASDTFLIERRDVAADGDIYLIALTGSGIAGQSAYSRGLPIDSGSVWKWSVGQTTGGDGAVPMRRGAR